MAIQHPQFDPVALHVEAFEVFGFTIGPLSVYWYGIAYLVAFAIAWWLGFRRAAQPHTDWSREEVSDFLFYGMLGVIVGGRLGYVFFYGWEWFLQDWRMIYRVWEGGMSFHGGLIGVIAMCLYFSWKTGRKFTAVTDFVAPLTPIGLGLGRVANFINGELWGKTTDVPWAMVFAEGGPVGRHPSQVYQTLLEGVLLFVLLWWFASKARPRMAVSAMFLLLYGSFRFFVEFFREPDSHLGYIAWDWLTMGQLLCIPMLVLSAILFWVAYRRKGES